MHLQARATLGLGEGDYFSEAEFTGEGKVLACREQRIERRASSLSLYVYSYSTAPLPYPEMGYTPSPDVLHSPISRVLYRIFGDAVGWVCMIV